MRPQALRRLLENAAGLLRADERRHHPAHFVVRQCEGDVRCVARLVWRLQDAGLRVVVADAGTGCTLCESLPGRAYDLERHADDDEGGSAAAPASTSATAGGDGEFPRYMADLVDRAASRLKAEGWRQSVAFTWWTDGVALAYTARIDWASGEFDPRVIVFNGLSGDFVCQSLPGRLHEIDPDTWSIDVAPDVVDEYEYHRQRGTLRPGARGKGQAT